MEQSDAVLLQALAMLIKAISEVPATFWGVIIGAGFSLSGVVLINKNNTTRLETQLANERIMKRAEREFNLKRDIYLECAEVRSGPVCLNSFSRKISGAIAGWMCSGKHGNPNRFSLRIFFFADGGVSAA